jgi:hypothetical protein
MDDACSRQIGSTLASVPRVKSLDPNTQDSLPGASSAGRDPFDWRGFARRFVANNWKVALYVVLILLCVLLAPDEPLKFIYTEF